MTRSVVAFETSSIRRVFSSLPKWRGFSPANGVIHDGSDVVITLATP